MEIAFKLIFSLGFIFLIAEFFVNTVEFFIERFKIPQSIAGSLISAFVTTLPENTVPLVSFLKGEISYKDIGIGSIFGGPFFLATFGLGTLALASAIRKIKFDKKIRSIEIDIKYAFLLLSIGVGISIIDLEANIVPFLSIIFYILYLSFIKIKLKNDSYVNQKEDKNNLFINLFFKVKSQDKLLYLAFIQGFIAIVLLPIVSHFFVETLELVSSSLNLNPFIVALALSPVATEMPELASSVAWLRRNNYIVGFSNISGSLVIQTSFPLSYGLIFTSWKLDKIVIYCAIITLIAMASTLLNLKLYKKINLYAASLIYFMLYFIFWLGYSKI